LFTKYNIFSLEFMIIFDLIINNSKKNNPIYLYKAFTKKK
jgi:hypothetical protein